jgi:hypothetical protein
MPAFVDDKFTQGVEPENVRTGFDFKVQGGIFNQIGFTGIGQNQVETAFFGAFFDLHPDDRVGKRRVSSYQENRFGGLIVLQKCTDRTIPQLLS